jgi:circadian clock protein KaiC
MTFDATARDLTKNVVSLGFDLDDLTAKKQLLISQVLIQPDDFLEAGNYNLDGLSIRLKHGMDSIGARRVVLDSVESLFSVISNEGLLRNELRRLILWLRETGVTAVLTGERGTQTLSRHGLEEYIADCVILLDHRIMDQIGTRRLRIVKYRGSAHGSNEYPFLIDRDGLCVLPITSLGLDHPASSERMVTGIDELDTMLGGQGYYRGSSLLVSGPAGTGKTSVVACMVQAACQRGLRGLFISFEESRDQIVRNMLAIGLDLQQWIERDLLRFHAERPTSQGLEMHLVSIHRLMEDFRPDILVIDPISSLSAAGSLVDATAMVTRLVDFAKVQGIIGLYTDLTSGDARPEKTETQVSSLMDVWILLQQPEGNNVRERSISILKARGIAHSREIREFQITNAGIQIREVP